MTNEDERIIKPVAQFFATVASFYSTYATILAFIGGTLWPVGLEISGGFLTGLVFIFIIDPIIITVFWVGTMIFITPIVVWLSRR